MKKYIPWVIGGMMLVASMGCLLWPKAELDPVFRDPVLKGRLAQLAADLHSDRNVDRVANELESNLTVYGAQITVYQRTNLDMGRAMLRRMQQLRSDFAESQKQSLQDEYIWLMPKSRERVELVGASL